MRRGAWTIRERQNRGERGKEETGKDNELEIEKRHPFRERLLGQILEVVSLGENHFLNCFA